MEIAGEDEVKIDRWKRAASSSHRITGTPGNRGTSVGKTAAGDVAALFSGLHHLYSQHSLTFMQTQARSQEPDQSTGALDRTKRDSWQSTPETVRAPAA
ncbi:hypothetical protein MTO96_010803 [Rhipicephalus appendiculatus]